MTNCSAAEFVLGPDTGDACIQWRRRVAPLVGPTGNLPIAGVERRAAVVVSTAAAFYCRPAAEAVENPVASASLPLLSAGHNCCRGGVAIRVVFGHAIAVRSPRQRISARKRLRAVSSIARPASSASVIAAW